MGPDELFDPRVAAESGANVMILLPDGTRIRYGETSPRGFYVPIDHFGTLVQAETTYELRVVTSEGELVTAHTTTPARFSIDEWV